MKILFYISLFLLLACTKEEHTYIIDNLNNNKITILGHGGYGVNSIDYPLNSIEAIMLGIASHADGSEIDIQLTKDSVLVAYHDVNLDDATYGHGKVYEYNWDQINSLEYRSTPYSSYKLADLDMIFAKLSNQNLTFTLDIKLPEPNDTVTNHNTFQNAILKLLNKYNMVSSVTIESSSVGFLNGLKNKNPNLLLYFYYADFTEALHQAVLQNYTGITLRTDNISKEQIQQAHDANIKVAVFGANAQNHDETIRKNVDIIQTDNVPHLVHLLKHKNPSALNPIY